MNTFSRNSKESIDILLENVLPNPERFKKRYDEAGKEHHPDRNLKQQKIELRRQMRKNSVLFHFVPPDRKKNFLSENHAVFCLKISENHFCLKIIYISSNLGHDNHMQTRLYLLYGHDLYNFLSYDHRTPNFRAHLTH